MSAGCERCGTTSRHVAHSVRLGHDVCSGCYHESFSREEISEAERVWRQHQLARAIRHAIEPLRGRPEWQPLNDLALDIELSDGAHVGDLLNDARQMGLEVEA